MSRARRPVAVGCALLVFVLVGGFPSLATAKDTVAFTIKDKRITESSGLATDGPNKRYWTVNDSGDRGVAYAIAPDGDVTGDVRFAADVQDVEAVALRDNTIYIADIGDNDEKRSSVTVYYIADPDPGDEQRSYRAVDFAYPDGPHDAEAFFLDGSGRMYIVTKQAKGAIYRAPADPSRTGVNKLEKVGDAPGYVTDAVYLPDDGKIALRTYVSVEIVDAKSFDVDARVPAPLQPQGESITVSLDGTSLLLGSEGRESKVYSIAIPTRVEPVPSSSASPPGTASPTPTPSPSASTTSGADDQDDDDDTTPAPGNDGTMLALGLAALVAVIAGAVVIIIRKP